MRRVLYANRMLPSGDPRVHCLSQLSSRLNGEVQVNVVPGRVSFAFTFLSSPSRLMYCLEKIPYPNHTKICKLFLEKSESCEFTVKANEI